MDFTETVRHCKEIIHKSSGFTYRAIYIHEYIEGDEFDYVDYSYLTYMQNKKEKIMDNKMILVMLEEILKDVKLASDLECGRISAQSKLEMLIKILQN